MWGGTWDGGGDPVRPSEGNSQTPSAPDIPHTEVPGPAFMCDGGGDSVVVHATLLRPSKTLGQPALSRNALAEDGGGAGQRERQDAAGVGGSPLLAFHRRFANEKLRGGNRKRSLCGSRQNITVLTSPRVLCDLIICESPSNPNRSKRS